MINLNQEMSPYKDAHPYFSPSASEHEKQFMLKEYDPLTLKYAQLMYDIAPKNCEKCEKLLKVPELCWRQVKNISSFLCYSCIGILEKEGAELEHDGAGRLMLKQNKEQ
jgi:hypothetical protein